MGELFCSGRQPRQGENEMKEIKAAANKAAKKMAWVVPKNDLEAVVIGQLLKEGGEVVFTTAQNWGASWASLEVEILQEIEGFDTVYGVELAGAAPANGVNVDHHIYEGDDRYRPESSLEQVAEILGVSLDQYQLMVAANDRDYIPGMQQQGAILGMDEEAIQKIVKKVRSQERMVQGITPEEEAVAEEAMATKEVLAPRTFLVKMAHSKCAPVTDGLFGKYDHLLVVSEDGETNYYGSLVSEFTALVQGAWAGAAFAGGFPSADVLESFIDLLKKQ